MKTPLKSVKFSQSYSSLKKFKFPAKCKSMCGITGLEIIPGESPDTRTGQILITKPHYLANTAPLFSQLKVLDIFSINSFSVATFMYSYHHNLLPSSFHDLFLSSNQVHQYETRLASQYRPHFCRTNIKQFSILYRGPKIWNSLPVSLISSPSIFVF